MHLLTREVVGWTLLALGVYVFFRAFIIFTDGSHLILEGGSLTFMGFVLFRGGIHLLKIAVAARLCMEGSDGPGLIPSGAAAGVRREIKR